MPSNMWRLWCRIIITRSVKKHESLIKCASCVEPGRCLRCEVLPAGGALKLVLHPSQFQCQDSTRACIEEMLQKDRDLEAVRDELHAMRGTLESSTARLAASEAAKGHLEAEVLLNAFIPHVPYGSCLDTQHPWNIWQMGQFVAASSFSSLNYSCCCSCSRRTTTCRWFGASWMV